MPPGRPNLPRITVVTPSFNQGRFLEQTIRSVLLQGYPNLEYFVMDGGSTDESVGIIRKYEKWLDGWRSGPDGGQAMAIQEGFQNASGDILCWINSDDLLLPGALHHVAAAFSAAPACSWFVGGYTWIKEDGKVVCKYYPLAQDFLSLLVSGQRFGQMAAFWTQEAYASCGGLDPTLRFCFDYDLFLKLARREPPGVIPAVLACYRDHDAAKSSTIWDTVGIAEKTAVQVRHGLPAVPAETVRATSQRTEDAMRSTRTRGLLGDTFQDPVFVARSIAARVRDEAVRRLRRAAHGGDA